MKHYIPRRITTRFPYMFEGENIGLSVAAGWTAIFEKLCSDIDTLLGEDKRNFHWVQCKEKFGVARWYWEIEGVEPTISVDIVTSEGNLVSFETKNSAPTRLVMRVRLVPSPEKLGIKMAGLLFSATRMTNNFEREMTSKFGFVRMKAMRMQSHEPLHSFFRFRRCNSPG